MDAYDLLYLIAFYHKLSRFGTWHYSNGLIIMENIKQYNFFFFCFFISHRTIIYPFIASKAPIILMESQGFETFADYFLKECT